MIKRIKCFGIAGIVVTITLLATMNLLNPHKAVLISDTSIIGEANLYMCGEIENFTRNMHFNHDNYNYVRLINRMTDSNAYLQLGNKAVDNPTIYKKHGVASLPSASF